jgi:class 3 adenylate cyclase
MVVIQQWWRKLQNIGIDPEMPSAEIRYIRTINGLVLIVSMILWLQLPFVIQLLPVTRYILYTFLVWPLLGLMIPLCNYYKHYTAARILYCLITLCTIFLTAIQLGPETANHLFMIAAIIGFFLIFPPREKRLLLLMIVVATAGLGYLEWYFGSNPGFLDLPNDFLSIARGSSLSAFLLLVIAITAYHYSVVNQAETNLEREHERSERLLLNILPKNIALRLKNNEKHIADQIENAGVLFADIVGFTELSEKIHHKQLVMFLDSLFTKFDQLVKVHGVEKIKMIGDAYMVASGLEGEGDDHHTRLAELALDMIESINDLHVKNVPSLGIRIGMHCGPVIAGVICEQKFAYDLWGDSVNTASRMESHGLKNQIQVSKNFYEMTKHNFQYETRGSIPIKGKGEMEVYVLRRKIAS